MKGKISKILISLLFLFLLLPGRVYALLDFAQMLSNSMQGVEGITHFMFTFWLILITGLTLVAGLLALSASLLQGAMLTPLDLNNSLVFSGWNFTLGIANTLFILIFVIIAISYILKIETIAQKKILVNLILVALLVNFSLLFVQAMADFGNILSNSLVGGNTNLAYETLAPFAKSLVGTGGLATVFTGTMLVSMPFLENPITGWVVKLGLAALFLGSIPTYFEAIALIIFGLALAGMLFTYWFFFTIRIYVFWALAIFAPLAFICLILPQTKNWWNEWLKHLIEWTFLGVVLLLWLILGLRLMNTVVPSSWNLVPIYSWAAIGSTLKYILFMLIYLAVGMYLMKKVMPALGSVALELGGALVAAFSAAATPMAGALKGSFERSLIGKKPIEEREKEIEKRGRVGRYLGKAALAPEKFIRWTYRMRGKPVEEVQAEKMKRWRDEMTKMQTPQGAEAFYEKTRRFYGPVAAKEALAAWAQHPDPLIRAQLRKYFNAEDIKKKKPEIDKKIKKIKKKEEEIEKKKEEEIIERLTEREERKMGKSLEGEEREQVKAQIRARREMALRAQKAQREMEIAQKETETWEKEVPGIRNRKEDLLKQLEMLAKEERWVPEVEAIVRNNMEPLTIDPRGLVLLPFPEAKRGLEGKNEALNEKALTEAFKNAVKEIKEGKSLSELEKPEEREAVEFVGSQIRKRLYSTISTTEEAKTMPPLDRIFSKATKEKAFNEILESNNPYLITYLAQRFAASFAKKFMPMIDKKIKEMGIYDFKKKHEPIYNLFSSQIGWAAGLGFTPEQLVGLWEEERKKIEEKTRKAVSSEELKTLNTRLNEIKSILSYFRREKR